MRINLLKAAVLGLMVLSGIFGCALFVEYAKGDAICANTSAEDYSRGYLQAVVDIVVPAYRDGIVKIPYNSTNFLALVPWRGEDG